jgi:glycine C-acetyltransferase
MSPIKKNIIVTEEIQPNEIISELCNKYYHSLKDNSAISNLLFEERLSAAHEVVERCKEIELYFYRRTIEDFSIAEKTDKSQHEFAPFVNLASNDYLGLTQHPAIIDAGVSAMKKFGAGSGSVPMLAGTTSLHKKLESEIASFLGYDSAITYNSCYAANYGLLTALLTQADAAVLDMSVHASIIDGCCNTNKIFFCHNDPASLKIALMKASAFKNKLVIIDGVYSMDGDIALLNEIMQVAKENEAWVMVDESHALGVIGDNGRGIHSYYAMQLKADIVTCSMGKALGGIGGFIAGSHELISFLELISRPFIFSTSIPQNVAAQLIEAIYLLQTDSSIHKRLWRNIHYFRKGIDEMGFEENRSESAIIPLIIRDEVKLLNFCRLLHDDGIFVNPIFYPVVPKRKSRIRISITAALSKDELDYALDKIETAARSLGIIQ